MTQITISCPITWWEQCKWIYENCREWKDETCWAGWQIGYSDIHFILENRDAFWFKLRWE